jgi:hypothetical protein
MVDGKELYCELQQDTKIQWLITEHLPIEGTDCCLHSARMYLTPKVTFLKKLCCNAMTIVTFTFLLL